MKDANHTVADWLQPLTHLLTFSPLIQPLNASADVAWLSTEHRYINGNKPWKLFGHLQLLPQKPPALLSFGGPHSNHLHALAACGQLLNVPTIGVVRGYAECALTPTLQDCQGFGMKLEFVDRVTYRRRHDDEFIEALAQQWQAVVVPEGGGGEPGRLGCAALAQLAAGYDELWLAVGTGTTAEGIARALAADTELVGVNVVADQGERQRQWQQLRCRWRLIDDMHGGGFGRINPPLRDLIRRYDGRGISLDPVYTAKLMQAYETYGQADKTALLLHTGGLQGRRSAGFSWASDQASTSSAAALTSMVPAE